MDIKGVEGKTNAQLKFEISQGARFVYFEYCISVFVFTIKRPTKTYFIAEGESVFLKALIFSLISFLFGWWGFPWGPLYTIQSLSSNISGGHDITGKIKELLDDGDPSRNNNGYIPLKHLEVNSRRKENLELTKNAFRSGFGK